MTGAGRAMRGAVIGLLTGAGLLGVLHLIAGSRLTPVGPANVALVYLAFAGLTTALGAATGYLHLPEPKAEPTRVVVVQREVGIAMRNGALCGVVYVLLRLGLWVSSQEEVPLWFLALYSGGMLAVFTLGLGLFGLMAGWMKARDLR